MSWDGRSMKVYPPKAPPGAKASDRLQEYLMHSDPHGVTSPHLSTADPESGPRALFHASLASVEAALIDNHVCAQLPPSQPAPAPLASNAHASSCAPQLPAKEKWKKFAVDVLTCIPQQEQEGACEGFLEAMRELMSQPLPPPAPAPSAPSFRDSRLDDRSSSNPLNSSWSQRQAATACSAFDFSQPEQDVVPRLEELLQMLRSPR
jgi:hypothetical protein